jgi:hypothetical protein
LALKNSTGTIPEKIVIEREIDPIKIALMGTIVQGSCLHCDGINYWSSVTNATEANKMVFWIKDQNGSILGRVLCGIDSENKIVRFPVYYTGLTSLDLNTFMNQYLREFKDKFGLKGLNGNKDKVENLVMSRWYKDPEVEVQ